MKQLLDKKTVRALWKERRDIIRDTKAAARLLDDETKYSIRVHRKAARIAIRAARDAWSDSGVCSTHYSPLRLLACYHLLKLRTLAYETPIALVSKSKPARAR